MPVKKELSFEEFVSLHKPQLIKSYVPEQYWYTLFDKTANETFDAGSSFMIQKLLLEEKDEDQPGENDEEKYSWEVIVTAEDGIALNDPKQIYLIDHAWTYRIHDARKYLVEVDGLLDRMASLMDLSDADKSKTELIEDVLDEMWKYNQTYRIGNADIGSEDAQPIWYVMDEFGSRIQHNDEPAVRVLPFYYAPTQTSYSILFPIKVLEKGDEVTRDYVEGCQRGPERRALRLLPWFPADCKHKTFQQKPVTPEFVTSFHTKETLPSPEAVAPELPSNRKIRVYSNMNLVKERFQTDDKFEIVEDEDSADIFWNMEHVYDYKTLSEERPSCFVGQFPHESLLTVKDLMSAVGRSIAEGTCDPETLETTPAWLQTTYNLETELEEFVSYFQHRESRNMENVWICKPWNLGRGLDIHITDNLNYILRLPDTGPKIACRYITHPVLLELDNIGGVKYDLRYLILLQSVKPLKVMVHHTFCSRVANRAFSLDEFDDFQKHFSVLAYKGVDIITVLPEEFVTKFEAQNPDYKWKDVQDDILRCIKELFVAATTCDPPLGLGHSLQSRAMYGIDIMLKWVRDDTGVKRIQPVINECNFMPDFNRHQWFRKEFVNDFLHALFLDDIKDRPVSVL